VEKTQRKQQFLENLRFFTIVQFLIVQISVSSQKIVPQPFRRFNGHFNPVLQNADREQPARHTGKPQPEIPVNVIVQLLDNTFQFR